MSQEAAVSFCHPTQQGQLIMFISLATQDLVINIICLRTHICYNMKWVILALPGTVTGSMTKSRHVLDFNWCTDSLCVQKKTCEHSRGVSALILPNKVAHVTRGMAGGKQAPHIDGAKLQVKKRTMRQQNKTKKIRTWKDSRFVTFQNTAKPRFQWTPALRPPSVPAHLSLYQSDPRSDRLPRTPSGWESPSAEPHSHEHGP